MVSLQNVNLVFAHKFEAQAVLEFFSLELVDNKEFKIYQNKNGMQAVITGMGFENAKSATAKLGERTLKVGTQNGLNMEVAARAWLNIGIAGHPEADIGSGFLASRIIHRNSGDTQFPAPVLTGLEKITVVTVDKPELVYPENAVYEMEAAGFWASAIECTSLEFVQVLKIVSDNKKQSIDTVTKQLVVDLIRGKLERINDCCAQLQSLVNEYNNAYSLDVASIELIKSCLESYHFTVTQKAQLKKLVQRYSALDLFTQLREITELTFSSSNELIKELSQYLSLQ